MALSYLSIQFLQLEGTCAASNFSDGEYARKQIAPGVSIVLQKTKGSSSAPMQIQAYRFSKDKFTADQARNWLKKHNIGIMFFEPASE